MAAKVLDATESGELEIQPNSHKRMWTSWLGSADDYDWCVSRQLWWGHRIPVYCVHADDKEFWVAAHSKQDAKIKVAEKEGKIHHIHFCLFISAEKTNNKSKI